jgi:predicted transcriptional regulator
VNVNQWKPSSEEEKQNKKVTRTRQILKEGETMEPEGFKEEWTGHLTRRLHERTCQMKKAPRCSIEKLG